MAARHHISGAPVRKFKGATVYEWDSEPAAERPSELVESVWAGGRAAYSRTTVIPVLEQRRNRPAQKRGGGRFSNALPLLLLAACAGGGLVALARWLPH